MFPGLISTHQLFVMTRLPQFIRVPHDLASSGFCTDLTIDMRWFYKF